jgi:hypothetical protein
MHSEMHSVTDEWHLRLVHLALFDTHGTGRAAAHPACVWQQQALVLRLPQHIPCHDSNLISSEAPHNTKAMAQP